jgi:hypothetical protein
MVKAMALEFAPAESIEWESNTAQLLLDETVSMKLCRGWSDVRVISWR